MPDIEIKEIKVVDKLSSYDIINKSMRKLAQIKLTISIFKQGDRHVVYSPALDLSTSGKTLEEAKRRFTEAALFFVEELDQAGTIRDVLQELGWAEVNKQWVPPHVSDEAVEVRLPVSA